MLPELRSQSGPTSWSFEEVEHELLGHVVAEDARLIYVTTRPELPPLDKVTEFMPYEFIGRVSLQEEPRCTIPRGLKGTGHALGQIG